MHRRQKVAMITLLLALVVSAPAAQATERALPQSSTAPSTYSSSTVGGEVSAPVPEPGAMLLLGSVLFGVGALLRRRNQRS